MKLVSYVALQVKQGLAGWLATQEWLTFSAFGWHLGERARDFEPCPGKFQQGPGALPLPPILGNGYNFTTSSSRKPRLIIIITGIKGVFDLRTELLSVFGGCLSHESGGEGEPDFHQEAEEARSQLSQGALQPGSGHVTGASA